MNRWEFDIEQVKTMTAREYMLTRIEELLFESAARNKLGLKYMDKAGTMTIKDYISNFIKPDCRNNFMLILRRPDDVGELLK